MRARQRAMHGPAAVTGGIVGRAPARPPGGGHDSAAGELPAAARALPPLHRAGARPAWGRLAAPLFIQGRGRPSRRAAPAAEQRVVGVRVGVAHPGARRCGRPPLSVPVGAGPPPAARAAARNSVPPPRCPRRHPCRVWGGRLPHRRRRRRRRPAGPAADPRRRRRPRRGRRPPLTRGAAAAARACRRRPAPHRRPDAGRGGPTACARRGAVRRGRPVGRGGRGGGAHRRRRCARRTGRPRGRTPCCEPLRTCAPPARVASAHMHAARVLRLHPG